MHRAPAVSLALALALAFATGCRRGPTVVLSNQSGSSVSNIVLSGNGFTNTLPSLAHGAHVALRVHPKSASSARLTFHSGRSFDSGNVGYLEDHSLYRVGLVIHTNGVVALQDPWP